jgi:hypothetical protein
VTSGIIADRIYSRSGVYLLIGVLIAFSGLTFFYLQTLPLAPGKDLYAVLVALLPRFGVLFFIELIAFFFLRQYRAAMDEFRYFEAIKRSREDNVAIVALAKSESAIDILKVIEICSFNVVIGKLGQGELLRWLRQES